MKKYIYIFSVLLLLSCGGSKDVVEDSRYKRKPLVEVAQQQLDLEACMLDAKLQQELGNTNEAMEKYLDILKVQPDYAPACYELGGLFYSQMRPDSALLYARKAAEADPENVWYMRRLADTYAQLKDGKHLSETWEAIVKQHPTTVEYYYELSNAYLMANHIPQSVAALDRLEKLVGVTEMVSMQKVRLWNAYGKSDKALLELEKLAESTPHDSKYSAILAQQYMEQGKYDKAKHFYDIILANNPEDEYIHISLATYYKTKNQPQLAYEELKKGFEQNSLDAASKLQILGSFYSADEFYGSYSKYAFPLMDQIMSQCSDKSEYALFYGDVLMRQNKYPEAAEQFETALKKDSSEYSVWEALLICLSESQDEAKMNDYAVRAQKLFPLHPLSYYLIGFSAFQHKDYAAAEKNLRECEKLGFPKGYLEFETYQLLGTCLYEVGNHDEAYAYYDKCLAMNATDKVLRNNYAFFLAEDGIRLDEALKMAEEAVKSEPNNPVYLDTYAWVLYKMGRVKEAKEAIEKALKQSPDRKALIEHYDIIRNAQ